METTVLRKFRDNLERQRQNLLDWLNGTPDGEKKIRLGLATESDLLARLQKLDDTIHQTTHDTFGKCDVCHEDVGADTLEMDFTSCVCIDHFSAEQKRQLEQDLELSHKVQKALLPKDPPSIPGMRIAALIQPAEIVGGDYFDFFRFKDGSYGIAIADVMGKGLPASMLVASLQASLRILVPEYDSPVDVVRRINHLFCHNIHLIKFISFFLARYNPETGILEYCNAGHNPPLHVHSAAGAPTVSRLRPTGPAIGLTESSLFEAARIDMQRGDSLLLYTDGVTEARDANAVEFGENRLADFVAERNQFDPRSLIDDLRIALREFSGGTGPQDDVTMLAAKRIG
ncbi:MAG: SpoIIE family protein phosphatase [Ignavibacteriae bacterium]|nr:SpoIIE family protein phosphatase [Ignavibacteriota bacterium]